jgi:dienelactone hydrolase
MGTASPGKPLAGQLQAYTVYDHTEGEHKFRMVVPRNPASIRGILVVGPYSGGDSRDYHEQVWYREFLNMHHFAFLGASNYYMHDYAVLQKALRHFAAATGHPELVHAPFAATGFSAGGGFTRKLMHADPNRVIAGVVVGSTMKLAGPLTDEHRRVPMLVINGELERDPGEGPGMAKHLEPVLAEQRPKGARWGWMAVQGVGHEFAGQEVLSMPVLDAAVRMRLPADADPRKGPVVLNTLAHDAGWVADNTTWFSGLTAVVPAGRFSGDRTRSSWLLSKDTAYLYRAYATFNNPLKITSPDRDFARSNLVAAGSSITITVDDSRFSGWKRLELYDGANRVGELTQPPARFTASALKQGYHAFSVLGTGSDGTIRTSNPVLVVVR